MRVDDSAKHVAALERLSRDEDFLAKILPERRTDQFSMDELTSLASALEADRRNLVPTSEAQPDRAIAGGGWRRETCS